MGDVALNAIPKGLANLVNTPITLWNLLQAAAAGMHSQIKDEIKPIPNYPMQAAEKMGLVDPAKEPQTGPQRIVDMAIQAAIGAAAIPAGGVAQAVKGAVIGATSGAAAQTTQELTGSTLLAVAAGAITPVAISGTGTATKMLGNATRKQTLEESRAVGYVVEPSSVRQPTSKVETVAGKAAIAQEAAFRNQEVTNKLAAKALGLPEDTTLTMGVIEDVREVAKAPYKEIAELSPVAKDALNKLQQARFEANDYFRYYHRTGDPKAGKRARSWDAQADHWEQVIEAEANKVVEVYGTKGAQPSTPTATTVPALPEGTAQAQIETREVGFATPSTGGQARGTVLEMEKVGQRPAAPPGILDRLRAGRQLLARTHDIERALNLGDSNVSAPIIGRMFDQGRPLTGELQIIGKFAQAFPRVAREVASVPPSGVSGTDAAASALLATTGAAGAGPAGLVAGGLPLLRGPARNKVLSPKYQDKIVNPPTPTPLKQTAGRAAVTGTMVEEENQ